jgi:STE24 endopeptidase
VYAGLLFFGLLYAPIDFIASIVLGVISRKHEYQADQFAAQTTGDANSLVTALKKMSVHNLSNLTPHPVHVFLHHSHPPVLARIRAMAEAKS